jgi:hypothetical protein
MKGNSRDHDRVSPVKRGARGWHPTYGRLVTNRVARSSNQLSNLRDFPHYYSPQ